MSWARDEPFVLKGVTVGGNGIEEGSRNEGFRRVEKVEPARERGGDPRASHGEFRAVEEEGDARHKG